jgi:hypothetical protein
MRILGTTNRLVARRLITHNMPVLAIIRRLPRPSGNTSHRLPHPVSTTHSSSR